MLSIQAVHALSCKPSQHQTLIHYAELMYIDDEPTHIGYCSSETSKVTLLTGDLFRGLIKYNPKALVALDETTKIAENDKGVAISFTQPLSERSDKVNEFLSFFELYKNDIGNDIELMQKNIQLIHKNDYIEYEDYAFKKALVSAQTACAKGKGKCSQSLSEETLGLVGLIATIVGEEGLKDKYKEDKDKLISEVINFNLAFGQEENRCILSDSEDDLAKLYNSERQKLLKDNIYPEYLEKKGSNEDKAAYLNRLGSYYDKCVSYSLKNTGLENISKTISKICVDIAYAEAFKYLNKDLIPSLIEKDFDQNDTLTDEEKKYLKTKRELLTLYQDPQNCDVTTVETNTNSTPQGIRSQIWTASSYSGTIIDSVARQNCLDQQLINPLKSLYHEADLRGYGKTLPKELQENLNFDEPIYLSSYSECIETKKDKKSCNLFFLNMNLKLPYENILGGKTVNVSGKKVSPISYLVNKPNLVHGCLYEKIVKDETHDFINLCINEAIKSVKELDDNEKIIYFSSIDAEVIKDTLESLAPKNLSIFNEFSLVQASEEKQKEYNQLAIASFTECLVDYEELDEKHKNDDDQKVALSCGADAKREVLLNLINKELEGQHSYDLGDVNIKDLEKEKKFIVQHCFEALDSTFAPISHKFAKYPIEYAKMSEECVEKFRATMTNDTYLNKMFSHQYTKNKTDLELMVKELGGSLKDESQLLKEFKQCRKEKQSQCLIRSLVLNNNNIKIEKELQYPDLVIGDINLGNSITEAVTIEEYEKCLLTQVFKKAVNKDQCISESVGKAKERIDDFLTITNNDITENAIENLSVDNLSAVNEFYPIKSDNSKKEEYLNIARTGFFECLFEHRKLSAKYQTKYDQQLASVCLADANRKVFESLMDMELENLYRYELGNEDIESLAKNARNIVSNCYENTDSIFEPVDYKFVKYPVEYIDYNEKCIMKFNEIKSSPGYLNKMFSHQYKTNKNKLESFAKEFGVGLKSEDQLKQDFIQCSKEKNTYCLVRGLVLDNDISIEKDLEYPDLIVNEINLGNSFSTTIANEGYRQCLIEQVFKEGFDKDNCVTMAVAKSAEMLERFSSNINAELVQQSINNLDPDNIALFENFSVIKSNISKKEEYSKIAKTGFIERLVEHEKKSVEDKNNDEQEVVSVCLADGNRKVFLSLVKNELENQYSYDLEGEDVKEIVKKARSAVQICFKDLDHVFSPSNYKFLKHPSAYKERTLKCVREFEDNKNTDSYLGKVFLVQFKNNKNDLLTMAKDLDVSIKDVEQLEDEFIQCRKNKNSNCLERGIVLNAKISAVKKLDYPDFVLNGKNFGDSLSQARTEREYKSCLIEQVVNRAINKEECVAQAVEKVKESLENLSLMPGLEKHLENMKKIKEPSDYTDAQLREGLQELGYGVAINLSGNSKKFAIKHGFMKSNGDWVSNQAMYELIAIRAYTGSGYGKMNKALWSGRNLDEIAPALALAISGLRRIKGYEGEVKRMTSLPKPVAENHLEGQPIVYEAYTSTSKRSGWEWSGQDRFVIQVNGSCAYVAPISSHVKEEEVLCPPGTIFNIVEKKANSSDGHNYIMEDIGLLTTW